MDNQYELPCEVCVQTANHCCSTDLVLNMADAMLMMRYAKKMHKDVVLGWHIDDRHEFNNMMMVPNKHNIDVRREPCVFLKDGRCEIYEDRPSICRTYGTQDMRCRYEYSSIFNKDVIAAMTKEDIRMLDEAAIDRDFTILGNIVTFKE